VDCGERRVPTLHLPEQLGVVDHDPGGRSEAAHEMLVEVREHFGGHPVRQVEVSEHLTPGDDRNPEDVIGGWFGGNPPRPG
jgi:hypothetical protein